MSLIRRPAVSDDQKSPPKPFDCEDFTFLCGLLLVIFILIVRANDLAFRNKACMASLDRACARERALRSNCIEKNGSWLYDHLEFSAMFPKHDRMVLEADGAVALRKCVSGEGTLRIGAKLRLCGEMPSGEFEPVPLSPHYNITFTGACIEVITDGEASVWTNADANDLCITPELPKCVPNEPARRMN